LSDLVDEDYEVVELQRYEEMDEGDSIYMLARKRD
jgi:hypothetical protein